MAADFASDDHRQRQGIEADEEISAPKYLPGNGGLYFSMGGAG